MQSDMAISLRAAVRRLGPYPLMPREVWGRPSRHDVWVLDCCAWMGMHCRVDVPGKPSQTFPRSPGIWHLYAPGVVYSERFDRPELRIEDMWLLFDMQRPPWPLLARRFASIDDPEGIITSNVRKICERQECGLPGTELTIHGQLIMVMGEILTAARAGGTGTPEDPWQVRSTEAITSERKDNLLCQVDAAVRRRLTAPPSLDELAQELGMSVSSIAHRFKEETGMTIVQRIRWLRIQKAKQMLAQPGATVKSVAHTLGFSSPFYLSKVFTEVAGLAARTYLRTYRHR